MQFAENVREDPAGTLMNRLSSYRIVRECSEYPCKGFRRSQGLPPPVLSSSATAEAGRLNLRYFPSQISLVRERENVFYFLSAGLQQFQKVTP